MFDLDSTLNYSTHGYLNDDPDPRFHDPTI